MSLTVLGVVVPTLDRLEIAGGPVVESEHDSRSCVVLHHDHSICTQVGANAAAVADAEPARHHDSVRRVGSDGALPRPDGREPVSAHLPRAPPAHV